MPAFPRSRSRLWRARLVACLSVLWVLFGAKVASAVTLVPMCGEHAETVIAPPVMRSTSDAVARAGTCQERTLHELKGGGLPERPSEPSTSPPSTPRVPPIYHRLFPVPRARVALERAIDGERAGHRSNVERPPR